jgi:hypothetical protein
VRVRMGEDASHCVAGNAIPEGTRILWWHRLSPVF